MRVRLLAFATAAEALGAARGERELAPGATVADLARALTGEHPALAARIGSFAFAVDGELAAPSTALADGCEVALLPPVSGG